MLEPMRKAAVSATLNIFETMYFTFLETMDGNGTLMEAVAEQEKQSDRLPEVQSPWVVKSEIHFIGQYSGLLRLCLPYDLSRTLTLNFMGYEDEVSESQILDMAGEMTNMICGNLFSSLDKTSVYLLSSPVSQKISLPERSKRIDSSEINLGFLTEGQLVTIDIQLNL